MTPNLFRAPEEEMQLDKAKIEMELTTTVCQTMITQVKEILIDHSSTQVCHFYLFFSFVLRTDPWA